MLQFMRATTLLLLFFLLPVHAEIYRWVDDNGNVVFTDEPKPGSEKVELPPTTTYTPIQQDAETDDLLKLTPGDDQPGSDTEADIPDYQIRIASPADGESIWVNNGNVTVSMIVEPALDVERGHRIAVELNGQAVSEPQQSTTLQLNNLSRGSYSLFALIVDDSGNTLASSASVSFQLHRSSIQNNSNLVPPGPTGGSPQNTGVSPPGPTGGRPSPAPSPSPSPGNN